MNNAPSCIHTMPPNSEILLEMRKTSKLGNVSLKYLCEYPNTYWKNSSAEEVKGWPSNLSIFKRKHNGYTRDNFDNTIINPLRSNLIEFRAIGSIPFMITAAPWNWFPETIVQHPYGIWYDDRIVADAIGIHNDHAKAGSLEDRRHTPHAGAASTRELSNQ